ncbi:MAG TPA: FAD-dependent monooxygenase [Steroidobacteraceae bacterium]|nr:FAD-dependent monooxygenase [Steroidobacteraceae bacterium]
MLVSTAQVSATGHPVRTPAGPDTHAIVIGASMAGLLAARVLCDHFARVTLVERDALPEGVQPRKGVPQGRHLHVLHTKGEEILNGWFPGLSADLAASGATRLDIPGDLLWFHLGGYNVRFQSGLTTLAMSRPLLENHIRHRVLTLPNLVCRPRHEAVTLATNTDRSCVTGIVVRRIPADGLTELIEADLVVDATGRGSRSPAWLESLGYRRPAESEVTIGIGYTTRLYRQNAASLPDAKAIFIQPTPPHQKRLGALFPIEDGRWIVTLGGYRDHHAPADERGFLAHARALSAPDLHRVLEQAEPVSDFIVHGFPSNLRRHYERMKNFPEGYLVIGDAMCSFNPIYAQGMTVSAWEAEALERMLRHRATTSAKAAARAYFTTAAQMIDHSWRVAAGEDFRYAGVAGAKALGTGIINWYVGRVHKATHRDPATSAAFIKVLMSLEAPTSLLKPAIALRVLKDARA